MSRLYKGVCWIQCIGSRKCLWSSGLSCSADSPVDGIMTAFLEIFETFLKSTGESAEQLNPDDHRHFLDPMHWIQQTTLYNLEINARQVCFNTNYDHTVPTIQPTLAFLRKDTASKGLSVSSFDLFTNPPSIYLRRKKRGKRSVVSS
jgi:hypothetical protein